jgi:hypothetical protein
MALAFMFFIPDITFIETFSWEPNQKFFAGSGGDGEKHTGNQDESIFYNKLLKMAWTSLFFYKIRLRLCEFQRDLSINRR